MKRFILPFCLVVSFVLVFISCDKEETKPEPMELEFDVQHASAYNAKDGAVNLNILSGEPPYTYFWNTGDTTSSISGVGAGEYRVKIVYGTQGHSFHEQSVMVEQPEAEPLELEFEVTDVANFGRSSGSISVSVSGGTPPYQYQWSTGASTAVLEDLFAGTYTLTVTDSGVPFSITTSGSATINQPAFVCEQDSIRDIDGNRYSTIQIGEQCWIGENLRTMHRPDSPNGELIPIEGRLCRGLFCENKEGAHYTWYGMMDGAEAASEPEDKIQGICPAGWHLPTRAMYTELEQWLSIEGNGGPGFFPGTKMKGENSTSGFDALFTGNWGFGIYTQAPYAGFWSTTELATNVNRAQIIYLTQDTPFINAAHQPKGFGFNVRCIKDKEMP